MKIRVLKFGGSSFPDLESYGRIAQNLRLRLELNSEVFVVVVSAMSGTTGKIQEAALKVNEHLSPEITDSILGTGEMVAAALMRAALEKLGIPTAHLTGYQLGIETDSRFTRARPLSYTPEILRELFNRNKVVVVAGGQARTPDGRLTMLGRNSSDMSAVVIAGILGVSECEIFSDVPGIYSADPYLVPKPVLLKRVAYDDLIRISRAGAKVLHYGAVEHAKKMKVSIICRGLDENGSIGTVIGQGPFAPMGVVNDNIVVLAFKNLRSLRRAQIDLEQAGLVVYELAGRRLAIWRENRAWSEVVTQLGLENSVVPGRKVIFSYLGKEGLNHQEVTGQEAHCRLAEWHAKIYGNRGRKRKSFDQKRRSQYSSLLIG